MFIVSSGVESAANVGASAHMSDTVDALRLAAPSEAAAIDTLVAEWLTDATSCPVDFAARCGSHAP